MEFFSSGIVPGGAAQGGSVPKSSTNEGDEPFLLPAESTGEGIYAMSALVTQDAQDYASSPPTGLNPKVSFPWTDLMVSFGRFWNSVGEGMGKSADFEDETDVAVLLRKIAAQDRQAFETFYYRYASRIGSYLMKLLQRHDWVDEGVNDVMLAVWQYAARFDPSLGKSSTWLFGIAHNKALKLLEKYRKHTEHPWIDQAADHESFDDEGEDATGFLETAGAVDAGPERTVMGWQVGELLQAAMEQLSVEHRAVIELCFSEGYSYQEIADIVDCPVNTVKTRMHHARKRLAELLARRGISLNAQGGVSYS